MQTIAVLGAGSWGSAVAIHLARNGHAIKLWDHQLQRLQEMEVNRINSEYLPEAVFPDNILMKADLSDCVADVDWIFIAVPSHAFEDLLPKLKPILPQPMLISWGSKGIVSGEFLDRYLRKSLGPEHDLVAVSGPSFAKEVAKQLPTAVVVASEKIDKADEIAKCFHSRTFRPYLSNDIKGIEIGGVVKNVLAIAVGMSDGLGYGANARAALITRGLVEMKNFGMALGADERTFNGLAGIGDLILTATDNQSRNRRFGLALGEGLKQSVAKSRIGQVVEGARNAAEIQQISHRIGVEMPICHLIYKIIYDNLSPRDAVNRLLDREISLE